MIYNKFLKLYNSKKKGIAVLIDPDSENTKNLKKKIKMINESSVDFIFVGGSTLFLKELDTFLKKIKSLSEKPVIIFPGSALQVSRYCDAILFLSLISGRNPQFLIGEQVSSAMRIKKLGIEAIPTGYILIESGRTTSVEFISNTRAIPRDKHNIVLSHAVCGELLGFKSIYLDGGSGAIYPVPDDLIKKVKKEIKIPLIVGGGIRSIDEIKRKQDAGADIVVIGNILEKDMSLLKNLKGG
uniref:Phosphoglycerol geranylgeranyltransferase n=1 Tax=candidate division WOR-3 bacterium TaxID=2052148 RepID=A0A7C4Y956_UNCW3